jgi:hypothetical protein
MEPGWNPMVEKQAFDRVYRLGQKNPVKIFKYIVDMENSVEQVCPSQATFHQKSVPNTHILASLLQYVLKVQKRKLELISLSFGDEGNSKDEKEDLNVSKLGHTSRGDIDVDKRPLQEVINSFSRT